MPDSRSSEPEATSPTTSPPSEEKESAPSLGQVAGRLDAAFRHELVDAGQLARLRRGWREDSGVLRTAFWAVAVRYLEPEPLRPHDRRNVRRWEVILAAWASLAGLHRRGRRLGAAMTAAGISEARLLRLLEARGEELADALRGTVHRLAAEGEPVNWEEIAWLVLTDASARREQTRDQIAADYYRAEARRETAADGADEGDR